MLDGHGRAMRLAVASYRQGRLAKSCSEYRDAILLDPNDATTHNELGCKLLEFGEVDTVLGEIQQAARAKPNTRRFLASLGWAQLSSGKVREAQANLREANRLQPTNPDPEIQAHLKLIERLAALDGQIDAILRGQNAPSDAEGRLDVAELCRVTGRFGAAARFYREVIPVKSGLENDLIPRYRLHAAIAAAQAGAGAAPAKDTPPLVEAERFTMASSSPRQAPRRKRRLCQDPRADRPGHRNGKPNRRARRARTRPCP